MRRFVLGLFAAIGILTVLAVIGFGIAVWRLAASRPSLPGAIVLRLDLNRGLAAGHGEDRLSRLVFGGKESLRDVLDALDRAAQDSRVKGVYARVGADNLGLATCQELRDAIREFRAKGKFAIAFADSFGEFGPGTRPYYLATAFDEIWLQPLGTLGLIGLRSESLFVRGLLDKLGIAPSFSRREEYKTATNLFTEHAMPAPQREEVEDLLDSAARQVVAGIAAGRKLPESQVAALIDRGPFLAEDAKQAGLIDKIGYRDEAVAQVRERAGKDAELVSAARYLRGAGHRHDAGAKIALIDATGLITAGDGDAGLLLGATEIHADRLVRAFGQAARDHDVRAIVFRIDSPGGSAVASETIWRAVARARLRGKPVIVSMGNLVGSGGYYIAAPADKIVAEPATLTGSIGVLAGKFVVADLLKKLGIAEDAATRGANAAMFSASEDFSPAARARLEAVLDATYQGFKERVGAGRHMSPDQVEAVAKGRVWSGEEAKNKGLVDALGGYETAFRLAKEAAKIAADQKFKLVVFPRERGLLERLYARLEQRDGDDDAVPARTGLAERAATLFSDIAALAREPGVLQMPPIGEIR